MNVLRSIGIACIVASPLSAQAVSSLNPPATQGDIATAIAAAAPPDCPAPMSDALLASAGTQPRCMTRPDAVRATQVQVTTVTTASDGTFSGVWPVPFITTPVGRLASVEINNASGAPIDCAFIAGSVSATGFSGKCWQVTATTLPTVSTALLGLVVSPINNAAGGLTVRVVGRQ